MKTLKPTNNAQRNTVLIDYRKRLYSEAKSYPRSLFKKLPSHAGRNNQGKITARHRWTGHKRICPIIDFKRYLHDGVEGTIKSIEYSPYHTSFISLVSYRDGSKSFIITPEGLKVGDKILSGESEDVPVQVGNNLPLRYIPAGTFIHNIELKPKKGGQLARSAGTSAVVLGKDKDDRYIQVKLTSKEVRKILVSCRATIGKVSNSENRLVKLGKAGRSRWRGFHPVPRGVAMNASEHPHGGGEQKTGIGHPSPLSPWGKKTLGKKTRPKNKLSNKFIVRPRRLNK